MILVPGAVTKIKGLKNCQCSKKVQINQSFNVNFCLYTGCKNGCTANFNKNTELRTAGL